MKNIIISLSFLACLALAPTPSLAVGSECDDSGGTVDLSADHSNSGIQTCTTDAVGMSYTFDAFGVCDGFPNLDTGLANCFNVINDSVTVDMANGSGAPNVSGIMPASGSYDYFFAVTQPTFKVKGEVEFAQAYLASNAASTNIGAGAFCTPKTASYSTDSVLNRELGDFVSLATSGNVSAIADLIPFACSTSSVGAGNEGEASFTINNVNMTGQPGFSARMNIEGFDWDNGTVEGNEVNVILLNAQNGVATSAATVDKVLFIKNRTGEGSDPAPLTIDGTHTDMDVTFTMQDGMQIFYLCDSNLNTIQSGVDCAILAPILGEAALTPIIATNP